MGYTIDCGDVMAGCGATFQADDKDGLLLQVAKHAEADHGVTEITPEVREAVEAAMKERPQR